MADPLFAAFARTLEDVAPTAINILNIWNWMKECINW